MTLIFCDLMDKEIHFVCVGKTLLDLSTKKCHSLLCPLQKYELYQFFAPVTYLKHTQYNYGSIMYKEFKLVYIFPHQY